MEQKKVHLLIYLRQSGRNSDTKLFSENLKFHHLTLGICLSFGGKHLKLGVFQKLKCDI